MSPFPQTVAALTNSVILRRRRGSAGPKDLNCGVSEVECASTPGGHLRSPAFFFAPAFLCLFLAGCGAARPSKYYQLTVPGNNNANPPAANVYPVTILVGQLNTSHLYREDHIVYSSSAEDMGTYEYQRWAEPPAEMIQDVIFRSLRSSGRYRSVYSLRSSVRGDYLLHGHLYDFKEITSSSMFGRLALEMELRDTKTGTTVWTHLYNHDEPVSGKNVSAVVAALNRNVQRATAEIAAGLDQYFSTHPPATPTQ